MNTEEDRSARPAHLSVLYQSIITALRPHSPGFYVDGTVGAGGHAYGILQACSPAGRLLGLDLDPQALDLAYQRLVVFKERSTLIQASYTTLPDQLQTLGWPAVSGIVVDLGVSSMQIDTAARGFSFQAEGPLDMRFNPQQPISASTVVNEWDEKDLADILWRYGEEPKARRIAQAIVAARPLHTTTELAALIQRAYGGQRGRIHPATRSFQGLRIAVNQELQAIEDFLPRAVAALEPGGRLAVIAFHSLEDRIVKQYFHREGRDCICPPEQPVCTCGHRASILEVTHHPIVADETEIQENPRARSARLRVAEKI
jgi:16S rRNA (cytosine1402-N4)-methyltransferase